MMINIRGVISLLHPSQKKICYVKIICAHVGNYLWTCLPAVGRVKSFRDEPPIIFCPPCRP